MPEQSKPQIIELDLGAYGDRIHLDSPHQLADWNSKEYHKWEWLRNINSGADQAIQSHDNLRQQLTELAEQWRRNVDNKEQLQYIFQTIKNVLEASYLKRRIFHSTAPESVFINKLRLDRGDVVAAGAYMGLLRATMGLNSGVSADFVTGLFEAFLFSRGIDWTGLAQEGVFDRLKIKYEENAVRQDARFEELKIRNEFLNEEFEKLLKTKADEIVKLQAKQSQEFVQLVAAHVSKLTAIEKTYDQKLALQKPVKYWQTKENFHSARALGFGIAAFVSTVGLGIAMAFLVHWVFLTLKADENPKHWQVGLVVIVAFFTIWFVRILVRMFFSHHHLATDAAERRLMILTFLAMSREGAEFGQEDKKLIVQHLFRSASDGLVKDDAAPPTLLEMLSRK